MATYVEWATGEPRPFMSVGAQDKDWQAHQNFAIRFYELPEAQRLWRAYVCALVLRPNTASSGRLYRDDPTVLAWQLANEPRALSKRGAYRAWIDEAASFIKGLDCNHMVTVGSEGPTLWPSYVNNDLGQVGTRGVSLRSAAHPPTHPPPPHPPTHTRRTTRARTSIIYDDSRLAYAAPLTSPSTAHPSCTPCATPPRRALAASGSPKLEFVQPRGGSGKDLEHGAGDRGGGEDGRGEGEGGEGGGEGGRSESKEGESGSGGGGESSGGGGEGKR